MSHNKTLFHKWLKGFFLAPYYLYLAGRRARSAATANTSENILADIRAVVGNKDTVNGIKFSGFSTENCSGLMHTIHEVFVKHDYDFLAKDVRWIVIDIGANLGVTSLFMANKPNVEKVFAFEPLKPNFAELNKNVRLNPALADKVESFCMGLGDVDTKISIPFNPNMNTCSSTTGLGSVGKMKGTWLEEVTVRESGAVLAPIIEGANGRGVFCKIDCEGAEFQILPNLQKNNILGKIDAIAMEVHGAPEEIVRILQDEGFFIFNRCQHPSDEQLKGESLWYVFAVNVACLAKKMQ
ncbi:MAG: FkbM family methyltransferase [Puniceicoccales bacterium]|jgi:FkbM family methyltransferase|nr:FkbM family methyltransferase [Puniceicoccales bacterium]